MMATLKQRVVSLEGAGREGFNGYAVVSSWDWPGLGREEAMAAYLEANGPIPPNKPVIVIGWGPIAA